MFKRILCESHFAVNPMFFCPKFDATSFYIPFHVSRSMCMMVRDFCLTFAKNFFSFSKIFSSSCLELTSTKKKQCRTRKMLNKKFIKWDEYKIVLKKVYYEFFLHVCQFVGSVLLYVLSIFFPPCTAIWRHNIETSITFVAKCDNHFNNKIHTKRLCLHHFCVLNSVILTHC